MGRRNTSVGRLPSHVGTSSTELSMMSVDGDGSDVLAYLSSTSTLVAATDEWRQYVPLIVISLVLVDIVLGSPLANLALAPMRRAAAKAEEEQGVEEAMTVTQHGRGTSALAQGSIPISARRAMCSRIQRSG